MPNKRMPNLTLSVSTLYFATLVIYILSINNSRQLYFYRCICWKYTHGWVGQSHSTRKLTHSHDTQSGSVLFLDQNIYEKKRRKKRTQHEMQEKSLESHPDTIYIYFSMQIQIWIFALSWNFHTNKYGAHILLSQRLCINFLGLNWMR